MSIVPTSLSTSYKPLHPQLISLLLSPIVTATAVNDLRTIKINTSSVSSSSTILRLGLYGLLRRLTNPIEMIQVVHNIYHTLHKLQRIFP